MARRPHDQGRHSTGTHVALLRGINVGGKNMVPMAKLKAHFESLGLSNVTTYINSGNVIFDSGTPVTAGELEKAFAEHFGFAAPILLRSRDDLLELVSHIPPGWLNDAEQRTEVLFLWDEYHGEESLDLLPTREGVDHVIYATGAVVWNYLRQDRNRTGLGRLAGSPLYRRMTARNVNTVRKLAESMAQR